MIETGETIQHPRDHLRGNRLTLTLQYTYDPTHTQLTDHRLLATSSSLQRLTPHRPGRSGQDNHHTNCPNLRSDNHHFVCDLDHRLSPFLSGMAELSLELGISLTG